MHAVEYYQTFLMWAGAAILALLALGLLAFWAAKTLAHVRRRLLPAHYAAFLLTAGVACWAAQKRYPVQFPQGVAGEVYLFDAGSYVESNLVHVAWTRAPFVPASALLYVDYRPRGSTNDAEWVNHFAGTFGEYASPLDFPIENATNWTWCAYTDWTPPPAVVTNGVWHAYWGVPTNQPTGTLFHALPVKTKLIINGKVLLPIKERTNE